MNDPPSGAYHLRLVRGGADREDVAPDVFRLLGRWQRYLRVSGRCNENTRRQYRRACFAFFADLLADDEGPTFPEISEDDVVAYLSALPAQGQSRGMILRSLRSFYGWCEAREVMPSPVRRLTPRRPKYGPAPALDPGELDKALKAAEEVDPRARWAIQLQYATACRAGSLVALKPQDVRQGAVRFEEAKGAKPYELALGPAAQDAVTHLLALLDYKPPRVKARRPTLLGVGYNAYENWIKKTSERSGVDLTSHLLRHTAITRLAEDPEVDVRTIVEIANWADPSLLRRYAKASDPNLRRALAKLTVGAALAAPVAALLDGALV